MKICDCDSPNEIQAPGARGYCQTCKNEIFQGPRNEVEQYLYRKLLSAQKKIEAQGQIIEKLKEFIRKPWHDKDVHYHSYSNMYAHTNETFEELDQTISAILNTQEG